MTEVKGDKMTFISSWDSDLQVWCVGQNIRKMAATFVCIHVAFFTSALWQLSWDMLSQQGLTIPVIFSCEGNFACSIFLWVAHNDFCVTIFADFFKKLYLVLVAHWLGPNPFEKGFIFLTKMKNFLSGKNSSQCLCFPFGLTRYFYPDGAASGNLWHTSVLHLFLFVPLGIDNYSFSKILSTWHIFAESRAFVWKSG